MRIAVPNKGRLHDPTMDLLERAGIHVVDGADRQLYADTVDPELSVLYARAADIPEYVADGAADLGITGLDQVREAGHEAVAELLDLEYGRCRLVVAAPEADGVGTVEALAGKTVATEFPRLTRQFFADRGVDVEVVEVTGATELTPHVDMADAIVDITSTGTTLQVNRLEVVAEVLSSSVHLVAREDVRGDPKTEQVRTALASVIAAEDRRYLMMNVPEDSLDAVREVIPGLGGPTVMDIDGPESQDSGTRRSDSSDGGSGKVAVHAVVDERDVFETISEVKAEGASGILVTEIERLVE